MFWYVGGELGVGWLGGDFENGCHGFVLCPGWFLCQHFHNSTPKAPGKGDRKKKKWELTHTIMHSVQRELPSSQHQGTALCSENSYKMALCSANPMCAQILSQTCQRCCFYYCQASSKVLRQGGWFPLWFSLHQKLWSVICLALLSSNSTQ